MTRAQTLIDRARSYGRDDGGLYLDDRDYISWLNEAIIDLGARLQLFEQETSTSTTGVNSISLPPSPELVEIQDLLLGTTDHVRFVSADEWDANVDAKTVPTSTIGQVFDEHIELYPTPKLETSVKLRYKRLPVQLVNGEDAVEIPSHLERKLIEYAAAHARYKDGDFDGGNNWNIMYEKGLPASSTGREKFFAQPLQVQRLGNIFDADPRASHV